MAKLCKKCMKELPVSSFYKQIGSSDGLRGSCKECCAEADRLWRLNNPEKLKLIVDRANKKDGRARNARHYRQRHPARLMLRGAKQRADKYGLPYDLVECDLVLPEVCPILGLKLEYGLDRIEDYSPSLDRIIPELGYVRGNIQVLSNLANRMKSNASAEQLKLFAQWVTTTYG